MDIQRIGERLEELKLAGRYAELEVASREILAQHRFFGWHMYLIVALLRTGRREEAGRELDDLFSYKFNIAERAWPEIREAFPEKFEQHYVIDTMKERVGLESGAHVHVRRRWEVPFPIGDISAFAKAVDAFIAESVPALPSLEAATTPVTTFGSCFAANLARSLKATGVDATNLLIEESINSPLANRAFLEGLVEGPRAEQATKLLATYGRDFLERAHSHLARARVIVMTLGVAPSFFHRDSGKLAFLDDYKGLLASGAIHMRTPSVTDTGDVVEKVIGLVRAINPQARLYMTISPVPLLGTVELSSAVIADCVSKSTLRAALHEVLQKLTPADDVHYWPSFEIVRWLGAHGTVPVFGADDGVSRHVSNWLVDMIVQRFVRHVFSSAEASTADSVSGSYSARTSIKPSTRNRWG